MPGEQGLVRGVQLKALKWAYAHLRPSLKAHLGHETSQQSGEQGLMVIRTHTVLHLPPATKFLTALRPLKSVCNKKFFP